MPISSIINRTGASALIPTDRAQKIWQSATTQSLVLDAFTRIPLPTKEKTMKVLSLLPYAYFVEGDTGMKNVSEASWSEKTITAEEIAVIVPIPESVLDDSEHDLWAELEPRIASAVARRLDGAVLFGDGAPTSWPDDLATAIAAASQTVTRGTATTASGGLAEDINDMFAILEDLDLPVTNAIASNRFKQYLRGARDTTGQKLTDVSMTDLSGVPLKFGQAGTFPRGSGVMEMFAIDREQFVVGVRQDISMKMLTEGVITDADKNIIWNLAQQDMVALRVTFRVGWQVANYTTYAIQEGGTNEVQTLTQAGVTSGATQVFTFDGYSTAALDREVSAADLQAALRNLASVGGDNLDVARGGTAGARVYTITYKRALGSQNVAQMTATPSAGTITPATTTPGAAKTAYPAVAMLSA